MTMLSRTVQAGRRLNAKGQVADGRQFAMVIFRKTSALLSLHDIQPALDNEQRHITSA
jgi:hypothetical protein